MKRIVGLELNKVGESFNIDLSFEKNNGRKLT